MRRAHPGPRIVHLLCVLLLAAPPAARLSLAGWRRARAPGDEAPAGLVAELESLRQECRRSRAELEMIGAAPSPSRYRVSLGDVLPVSDPSHRRGALWAALRNPEAVHAESAALWNNALVGRVLRVCGAVSLAQVQTLADPSFRVRFACGSTSGMLHGTGRRDLQGHPLLEIRHVSQEGDLPPGEVVFTAGDDGIYPPGLRIGSIREDSTAEGERSGRGRVVGAECAPEDLTQVLLAVDLAAKSLDRLLQEPGR